MAESIRAVERALEVLMCFTNQTPALTMTQISEMIGINKSTVHRLLATLELKRFVERDSLSGLYRPGIRFLQVASMTLGQNELRRLAASYLQDLCNRYRENVNLSILDNSEVVYLDIFESPQRVKLAASLGQRLPAFCTASGKAILAFLPEENVKGVLEQGMQKFTQHTITSLEKISTDLQHTRERGFAISEQEFEEGINAVAVPICDPPIGSISIAGPAYRLTRDRMFEIGVDLIKISQQIEKEIQRTTQP